MLFIVFLSSLLINFIIILLVQHKGWLVNQHDLQGVQKCHENLTARIGGVPVFFSFSIGLWLLQDQSDDLLIIWLASLPVLFGGVVEDLSARVSPQVRLLLTLISIIIVFFWLDLGIVSLGFEWVDYVLSNYMIVSLLFTLLVVGGAVNSLNIIDGLNGLMAGYTILALLAMAYVAYILSDNLILQLSLLLASSVFGFFVVNFPFGKIFMGDGGAYFVGFMLASIGLLLVNRHDVLSNWFVLLIFIYPMYEVLFSMFRRRFVEKSVIGEPDALHLHSLIYRKNISCEKFKNNRIICNSMTSPFLWILSLIGIIPAIVWYDNQTMLIICAFVFMLIYTMIYRYILQSKCKFNYL